MKTTTTDYSHMDDLVFENRNIAYGAYTLRQRYDKHLCLGLLFTFGIFALGMGVPEFLKNFKDTGNKISTQETGPIILTDLPNFPPPPPLPPIDFPPPPPPPTQNFIPAVTDQNVPDLENIFMNNAPTPPSPVLGDANTDYVFDPNAFLATTTATPDEPKEPDTFITVEIMPEFKGNLAAYLGKNIKYPAQAEQMGIDGKVYVSFIVAADGSIQDVKLLRGVYRELDDEALRVVKNMPKWKPGKQSGRAVAVHYTLPIVFQLNNQN